MGLAASQARLLTITSRKSDCEYDSMALSHQKIALARDMNIVSAKYQDALNQTKLVYDFYGTGDTTTDLTYGLLMTPSKLNNYMPTPVTDPSGRLVLDAKLAAAARAAGIPQEGLGCTPSSDIREKFIDGLVGNNLITRTIGENIKGIQYNPTMGLGTQDIVTTYVENVTFEEFMNEYLNDITFDFSDLTLNAGNTHYWFAKFDGSEAKDYTTKDDGSTEGGGGDDLRNESKHLSIADLLANDKNYVIAGNLWDSDKCIEDIGWKNAAIDKIGSCSFWDELFDTLASAIDPNDTYTAAALEYAKQNTLQKVVSLAVTPKPLDVSNAAHYYTHKHSSDYKLRDDAINNSSKYVGYIYIDNPDNSGGYNDAYGISLSNMTKAFYTYFAAYMEGLATSDLKVTTTKDTSTFVTDPNHIRDFSFNVLKEVDTTGDNMLISGFYDAVFNQIATKGWVENENINDKDYMQTMLQNGCVYLSALADDDYYYMSNYATNTYIKEITDEEGIAKAEAEYQREKSKINSKENIIDMKMKNLDTEITALTTEYDTIKSVISNGVKTGFTRYEA